MSQFEGRRIAVVDDERLNLEMLETYLTRNGASVVLFTSAEDALDGLDTTEVDAVVTDVKLGGMTGLELLKKLRPKNPNLPVLMMTAYGTIESAVEAMYEGAYYYLTKPFKLKEFGLLLARALEHSKLIEENIRLKQALQEHQPPAGIIGGSAVMRDVLSLINQVAPTQSNVLILGESGTGKEVVARAIHQRSTRTEGSFVSVNCAALPEGLIESELFGHVRGSFTGAIRDYKGKFEMAENGTILLDEVSEMPLSLQPKLLRVIQEREYFRVGSGEIKKTNVRVIATSNRNLQEEVAKGRFRQDLYFRLNVIPIQLPPLRDRKEDILELVKFFVDRFAKECKKEITGLSEDAMVVLRGYNWPGNVRELENAIERAVVLANCNRLEKHHFLHLIGTNVQTKGGSLSGTVGLSMHELEKQHLLATLSAQGFNRTRTAEILDISIRTLRNKINEYRAEGTFIGESGGDNDE
ncbi:MAG: sigma-54 dependent transcriptional regulator [bacterium]|nr:sigma-54 dependent transcriptional regulator [bacterium]